MTGPEGESTPSNELVASLAGLVRSARVPMTPQQRMLGLSEVMARVRERRRARARVVVLSAAGLVAAAGAVVIFAGVHGGPGWHRVAPIAYRIESGEIGPGGYVRSSGPEGARVRFAEGTSLHLKAHARGRLGSVDERGARFAIEEGEAEVEVTPRPNARWLVDAGPFLITVRGTAFTAAWDGASEQLDLRMAKGVVSVVGPVADGDVIVKAGQRLTVNVAKREVVLRETDAGTGSPARVPVPVSAGDDARLTATPATVATAEPPAGAAVKLRPSITQARARTRARTLAMRSAPDGANARATAAADHRSWSEALAAGDLDGILREAGIRGLAASLADASSEDLAALSDAARYRRRDDVARQALLAQRARFPRSQRADDAAFLLGRLEEARPGGAERALEWYDAYLKEAPSGGYAPEALGRKMTATERLRGISAAREVADEYLRRFPNGTYAGTARAFRRAP